MFLIMLFGILANTSIIIIILKNKLLRLQPMNLFLLNLAVSDLLHLCISPLLYLFKRDTIFTNYYLGKLSCLATPFFRGKSFAPRYNVFNSSSRLLYHPHMYTFLTAFFAWIPYITFAFEASMFYNLVVVELLSTVLKKLK